MNTEHYASRATIFVIRNQNLTRLDGDGNLLVEYEDFWIKLKQEEGNKRKNMDWLRNWINMDSIN